MNRSKDALRHAVFCAALLKGTVVPSWTSAEVGSLVCAAPEVRSDSARYPGRCPLLLVSVDSGSSMGRVLSTDPWDYRLPLVTLIPVGKAALGGRLLGASDTLIEELVPSPNPGTLRLQRSFALYRAGEGGRQDTLTLEDWPALLGPERTFDSLGTLLDSLQAAPYYGLLQGPMAPPWSCLRGPGHAWKTGEGGGPPERIDLPAPWNARVRTLAKSKPGASRASKWIFVEAGKRYWIWLTDSGQAQVVDIPFMENAAIDRVWALDMDGDARVELFVETTTYYGDGSYSTLYMLPGQAAAQPPRIGRLEVSGSSGEPGGSQVESEHWAQPPRYYLASVTEGNEKDSPDSHDLRLEVHRYSGKDGLRREKSRRYHAVHFGKPDLRSKAEAQAERLMRKSPAARKAGLRALPRLTRSGIRWQATAIATDSATARAWTRWDKSGKVHILEGR